MKNPLEEFLKIFDENKNNIKEIERKAIEDPDGFMKEYGIDPQNFDLKKLKDLAGNLVDDKMPIEDVFSNKNFKDLNNFYDSVRDKPSLTDFDKEKLQDLEERAFGKDLQKKEQFCFIDSDCNQIINAHSIQENGELSLIAQDGKVLHFVENRKTGIKERQDAEITQASTFKGFCHKHDQVFEPIDEKTSDSDEQKYFLYSLRSFAHSYFNINFFKDYYIGIASKTSSGLDPLIKSVSNLADAIGYKPPSEFTDIEPNKISEEQQELLELERFENHRKLLIKYINENNYNQLDYLVYETEHLCPIVCASWMVMHISFGNGFLIHHNDNKPYFGFPIIISVLPDSNRTKIILARFKNDYGSELIFNQFTNLLKDPVSFEKEISKCIIENVENFYLGPEFWSNLHEQEKQIVSNAVAVKKSRFPENRTQFDIINFFDKKYKLKMKV